MGNVVTMSKEWFDARFKRSEWTPELETLLHTTDYEPLREGDPRGKYSRTFTVLPSRPRDVRKITFYYDDNVD